MANKTRSEIRNQIYGFLPQVNQTVKLTLVNNCIDWALEDISKRHDFRCLRERDPDTAALAAGGYYVDLSDFSGMGTSTTYFKDILVMRWLKAGTEDYGKIKFIDDTPFHERWGYIDYASRTRGKPVEYTRIANRFFFNCPSDEAITIRCWYQKFHGPLLEEAGPHLFDSRSNMTAFFAIVYGALTHLKASLTSVEFPQELQAVGTLYEQYVQKLIADDRNIADESFEIGWGERSARMDTSAPYDWV